MKVHETVRGSVPKVKMSYVATPCMHCQDAPCIPACKESAIDRRDDGLVLIHAEQCNGCKDCMEACPYDAIYFNEALNLAQKCTGCAHLLDQGWKEPRCVDACATGALKFIEVAEDQELFDNAEVLHPEFGTKPLVVYYNLPKRFIGGAVYDPEADECLEGVEVVLTDMNTGQTRTALTDVFGDFWFQQIEASVYQVVIKKEGYLHKVIENVSTEKDINIGDITLDRVAVPV
jgi:Fe-S-cluster-containing dehydrogenase component